MSERHGVSQEPEEFGREHGLIHEAVITGRKVGAGKNFWKKLAHDQGLFQKTVAFVHRGGHSEPASQVLARHILGQENLWGPEDWIKLGYSDKLFKKVPDIPWTPEELEEVKNTHFLHLGMETLPDGKTPLTAMALHEQKLSGLPPVWLADWLKDKEPITKTTLSCQWYLTKKEIVENSTNQTYDAQLSLLNNEKEEPPSTIQEIQKSLLYYKKTGKRLNPAVYARTKDFVGSEDVVVVGRFGCCGGGALYVGRSRRGGGWSIVGLGASRKS